MKAKRRTGMVVMLFAIVALGLLLLLGADAQRTVSAQEPLPELCGDKDAPLAKPLFAPPTVERKSGPNGSDLIVQNGVYVNEQGEIFGLVVKGPNQNPVLEYTRSLLVCFDQIYTGEVTKSGDPAKVRPTPTPGAAIVDRARSDVFVQFFLLGFVAPEQADKVAETLVSQPFSEWGASLKEFGALPEQARPKEYVQDNVVNFIFDPTVNGNITHQYNEKGLLKAVVTVEISRNSVTGGLCWKGTPVPLQKRVVSVDATRIASMTKSTTPPATALFDVGVRGMGPTTQANQYRLSGHFSAASTPTYRHPSLVRAVCNP